MFSFDFGFKDIVDILLVACILYETYRLLRRSGAANLFWGILAFIVVWFLVSFVFQLDLTGALFDRIISVGAIALIVIFQEEIRSFFSRIGARFSSFQFLRRNNEDDEASRQQILEIINACRHMASTKTGALIVIAGESELKEYTGQIALLREDRLNVLTIHAEAEGGKCAQMFDEYLERVLAAGYEVFPLGEAAKRYADAPVGRCTPQPFPGREGWLAVQE